MDNLQKITPEAVQADIKVCKKWLEALETCTFHGRHAQAVSSLTAYVVDNLQACERKLEELKNPRMTPSIDSSIDSSKVPVPA